MSAILTVELPELSGSGGKISPAVDRIARHCLEKNAERRYQGQADPPLDETGREQSIEAAVLHPDLMPEPIAMTAEAAIAKGNQPGRSFLCANFSPARDARIRRHWYRKLLITFVENVRRQFLERLRIEVPLHESYDMTATCSSVDSLWSSFVF
jgi:hypothetical protein